METGKCSSGLQVSDLIPFSGGRRGTEVFNSREDYPATRMENMPQVVGSWIAGGAWQKAVLTAVRIQLTTAINDADSVGRN